MLLDLRSLETAAAGNTGVCSTSQGGQGVLARGTTGAAVQPSFGPGGYCDGPIQYTKKTDVELPWPRTGVVETAQGAQGMAAIGHVQRGFEGAAASAQGAAEVIALGTVDNRKPNNRRKAKLAALLLAA